MLEFLPPLGSQDEAYRRAFEFRASNSADGADFVVLGSQPADMVFPPDTLWSCGPGNGNGYRYVRVVKTDGQPFVFQEVNGGVSCSLGENLCKARGLVAKCWKCNH
jgi:hypothetical protein